jgi:hypothetical protein
MIYSQFIRANVSGETVKQSQEEAINSDDDNPDPSSAVMCVELQDPTLHKIYTNLPYLRHVFSRFSSKYQFIYKFAAVSVMFNRFHPILTTNHPGFLFQL